MGAWDEAKPGRATQRDGECVGSLRAQRRGRRPPGRGLRRLHGDGGRGAVLG